MKMKSNYDIVILQDDIVKKFYIWEGVCKMKYYWNEKKGITLIALVVTIIVLLVLARNKYKYAYRAEWNFE